MADHLDAPGLTSPAMDARVDITDLYAFQKPGDPERTVLIFNVNPLAPTLAQEFRADAVVLNRVVCCYPDYERLLAAAADHSRRLLVFSYPRRNLASRIGVKAQNLLFGLLRKEFRVFAHPPAAMFAVLEQRGLRRTFAHHGLVWQVAGLVRA